MLRAPEEPDVHCDSLAAVLRWRLSWLVVLVVTFVATPTLADPGTEKAAQALEKKAIEEDSLNVNYPGAIKKLESATKKCGADKCNPQLRASLFRDLGAMQILNGATDEGKANFAQAISLQAAIELDPAYKTPQLEGIWADVKKNGAAAGGGAPAVAGPQPTGGDFTVTPPSEAQVRTPLPIYVEYGGSEDLARVTIKYKGAGMSDWKSLDLPKLDPGYGALIPCKDAAAGLMLYFVQGFNDKNDPVATSGSKKQPYSVPVNAQLVGPAPTLPGQDPPAQCEDVAGAGSECPPDFPGCGKKKGADEDCQKDDECDSGSCSDGKCGAKKQNGDECTKDSECSSDQCSSGKCSGGKKAEGEDCESDEDCDSSRCKEDKCAAGSSSGSKGPKVWIGVSVSLDATILSGANNVCKRAPNFTNTTGYSCAQPGSSTQFLDNGSDITNYQNLLMGTGDQVLGGFRMGDIRFLASLDFALGKHSLLGFRAGYVLGTAPIKAAFPPLHAEARYTYLFGKDAVSKVGLAPLIMGGVGAGEFDAAVAVPVSLCPTAAMASNCNTATALKDNTQTHPVNAWAVAGPVFVMAGAGVRYLATSHFAVQAALKFQAAFGGTTGFLPGFAPELGVQYGF